MLVFSDSQCIDIIANVEQQSRDSRVSIHNIIAWFVRCGVVVLWCFRANANYGELDRHWKSDSLVWSELYCAKFLIKTWTFSLQNLIMTFSQSNIYYTYSCAKFYKNQSVHKSWDTSCRDIDRRLLSYMYGRNCDFYLKVIIFYILYFRQCIYFNCGCSSVILSLTNAASFTVQDFHERASRCKHYLEENSFQPISIEFYHDLHLLRSRARHHK